MREYSREELLACMDCYLRMIKRDNGQYPTVTLNDIEVSLQYILKLHGIIKD